MTTRVTVVVAIYDGDINIDSKVFKSIRDQSFKNIEVIAAVKNRTCADTYDGIQIVDVQLNENCFIQGACSATGDYIVFLEQWESLTVNWIYSALACSEQQNADVVVTPIAFNDQESVHFFNNDPLITTDFNLTGREAFNNYLKGGPYFTSFLTTGNKLFRHSLFLKIRKDLISFFRDKPLRFYGENEVIIGSIFNYSEKTVSMRNHFCVYEEPEPYLNNMSLDEIIDNYAHCLKYLKEFINVNECAETSYYNQYKKVALRRFVSVLSKYDFKVSLATIKGRTAIRMDTTHVALNWNPKEDGYFEAIKTNLYPHYSKYEEIVSFISKSDTEYVMFDVFDTLVLRVFWSPTQLFNLVEVEFAKALNKDILDFPAIRHAAILKSAKWSKEKYGKSHTRTIVDAYDYIAEVYQVDKEAVDFARNAEYEGEIKYSYPRKSAKELFELAQYCGKKVIVVSDMYLPDHIIRKLLEKCGYSNFELFVSSQGYGAKAGGHLYEHIKREFNIDSPDKSCMIGDNIKSDVTKAMESGFCAFHFPMVTELIKDTQMYRHAYTPDDGKDKLRPPVSLGTTILLKIAANCLYDFPFCAENEAIKVNSLRHFSYFHLGMFSVSFVKWLIDDTKERNIRKIHFCSRDSRFLKNVYDKLFMHFEGLPDSSYLTVSRGLMYPLQAGDTIDLLQLSYSTMSPNKFVDAFKMIIPPDKFENATQLIEDGGFEPNEKFVSDKDRFIKFVIFARDELFCKILHEKFCSVAKKFYSSQIEPTDVLVDSGYGGRIEATLTRLLGFPIDSYYFTKPLAYTKKRGYVFGFNNRSFFNYSNTAFTRLVDYEVKVAKALYEPAIKELDLDGGDLAGSAQDGVVKNADDYNILLKVPSEDLSLSAYMRRLMHNNLDLYVDELNARAGGLLDTFFFEYPYVEAAIPIEAFFENIRGDLETAKILV